ncbi:MAG: hypothetical protein U1E87_05925 [Alphaproteobacteria bacterium]
MTSSRSTSNAAPPSAPANFAFGPIRLRAILAATALAPALGAHAHAAKSPTAPPSARHRMVTGGLVAPEIVITARRPRGAKPAAPEAEPIDVAVAPSPAETHT